MRKLILFVALAAAPLAAAHAQNMTVSDFLSQSDAMVRSGRGTASGDYSRLQRQLTESARLARIEKRIARSEHRAPRACLRAGRAAATSDEVLAHLRAMPAAQQQTTTVRDAYMQLMARKWPCHHG
jgi:hypothetical protein